MRKAVHFALLLFKINSTFALSHSLKYVFTGTSGIPNFPEFMAVGLLDGEPFEYYDSQTRRVVPRQAWVTEAVEPDCWDGESQHFQSGEPVFKANIEVAKQRFNQTGGVHTIQVMYGCELDDDGTIHGFNHQGYDGEDFISLDMKTLTWTAANPKAVITKQKWDLNLARIEGWKGYLENTCIEWLKKYVAYGRDTLERKVVPKVSLLQRNVSSPVTCHATGFFPRGVMMSWQKDGLDLCEDVQMGETVPNGDGTFQKRSTLRVSPEDLQKHTYTCTVQHSSSDLDIVKTVVKRKILRNSNSASSLPFIIIIIIIIPIITLLTVVIAVGFLIWRKRTNSVSDGSSRSGRTTSKT